MWTLMKANVIGKIGYIILEALKYSWIVNNHILVKYLVNNCVFVLALIINTFIRIASSSFFVWTEVISNSSRLYKSCIEVMLHRIQLWWVDQISNYHLSTLLLFMMNCPQVSKAVEHYRRDTRMSYRKPSSL